MTTHTDRIRQMAREAGFDTRRDAILMEGLDITRTVERFAQLVAEDCANTSPNGLDIRASAGPAEVWTKFRDAIRARYSRRIDSALGLDENTVPEPKGG